MAPPYKPLSAAHQRIFDAYVKAIPDLTHQQLATLRSNIRLGKTLAKDFGGKLRINDEIFRKEYKNFQKLKKNIGTDLEFAEYLNKNYKPRIGDIFNKDSIQAKRLTLKIKSPVPQGTVPIVAKRFNEVTDYATKLVNKANTGEKFVMIDNAGTYYSADDIKSKVRDKFKLKSFTLTTEYYPILNKLHTRAEKIDLVLRNMLSEDTPLKQNWVDEVVKRTGISREGVGDNLNKSKEYNKIKDKGADYIKRIGGKKLPSDFYTMSFSKQLPYALEVASGHARYTGMGGETKYGSRPQNKIMQFAMRSWDQLKGSKDGPIQFFKKGSNTPITWKHGLKLSFPDVSFSYNGKKHSFNNLRNPNYMKTYFPELYAKQNALNRLGTKLVDNPFKKGTTTVRELINEVQKKAYKWKPSLGPLDVLHGKKGVSYKPFTDLTYSSKDINQLEAGIGRAFKAKRISRSQANEALKIVRSDIKGLAGPELDTAIIDRQINLAKRVKAGTLGGYGDLSDAIRTLYKTSKGTDRTRIQVILGCRRAAESGGRIGFAAGTLDACVNTKLTKQPLESSQKIVTGIEEGATGVLGKIKNVSGRFLSLLGRGGLKAAPLAALAAAGAAIEPLVKQFRNDDYSTYLSDPEQQGSMLLAMVEQQTPKVDDEILKWQLPVTAAGAASAVPGSAAMMAARKAKGFGVARQALGPLGKVFAGTFSPLAAAITTPLHIAAQRSAGTDYSDIATDPLNWMGPAFAGTGARMATRGMNPAGIMSQALRLGFSPGALRTFSSRLGMPGLALTAGMWGYDKWKNRDKDDEFKVRTYKDDDD